MKINKIVCFMMIALSTSIAHSATYYVDGSLTANCVGGAGTSYSVTTRNPVQHR